MVKELTTHTIMLSALHQGRSALNRTSVGLTRHLPQSSVNLHRYNPTAFVCRKPNAITLQNFTNNWQMSVLYPSSTSFVKKFHTNVPQTRNSTFQNKQDDEYDVIYRFPYMRILAAISRFKIAQTTFMVVLVPITITMAVEGDVTWAAASTVMGMGIFSTVMLYAMSTSLMKVIGVMSINKSGHRVRISHLNFWGRREELYIDTNTIVPMTETGDKQGEVFRKLMLYDSNLTMYYTFRWGQILDKKKLSSILGSME